MASTSLVRKRSPLPKSTFREREEVVVGEEYSKRQSKRQVRTKGTEDTIQIKNSACNSEAATRCQTGQDGGR